MCVNIIVVVGSNREVVDRIVVGREISIGL